MPQEQIKAHIREEGESLKNNIEEIQSRVRDALDWKVWYRNNTALAIGGAAVGGFALSLLLSKSRTDYGFFDRLDSEGSRTFTSGPTRQSHDGSHSRMRNVIDTTIAAATTLAAEKLQDVLSQAIPGFRQHYSDAKRKRDQE